jgi:hypothetical protein
VFVSYTLPVLEGGGDLDLWSVGHSNVLAPENLRPRGSGQLGEGWLWFTG